MRLITQSYALITQSFALDTQTFSLITQILKHLITYSFAFGCSKLRFDFTNFLVWLLLVCILQICFRLHFCLSFCLLYHRLNAFVLVSQNLRFWSSYSIHITTFDKCYLFNTIDSFVRTDSFTLAAQTSSLVD